MEHITKYLKSIKPEILKDNPFKLIGNDWMLITAGTQDNCNTMTASWGTLGILWNQPVAICFIRPTRYTYNFSEAQDFFTLSFFEESYRKILNFCGSKSGRDVDKIAATGLTPVLTDNQAIGFSESRLCLECRKIYYGDLKPENFLLSEVDTMFYPKKDYHRMYIGSISSCYIKE